MNPHTNWSSYRQFWCRGDRDESGWSALRDQHESRLSDGTMTGGAGKAGGEGGAAGGVLELESQYIAIELSRFAAE